jgi:nucleotide-binding universal stress UspA family protein
MTHHIEPFWIKPSTILFATESPTNERAFAFALASAKESNAKLIILHVYDTLAVTASEFSGVRYYDYAAAARSEESLLSPLAQRATDAGVANEIVVRPGLAAPQILSYANDHPVDRIIMATRSPSRLGKLFVGSVAEEVVRAAHVPVLTVGPEALEGTIHTSRVQRILTAVSLHSHASMIVAELATLLAAHHNAHLTLLHVMPSRVETTKPGGLTLENIESELRSLVPPDLRPQVHIESITSVGDPAAEILYQSNLRQIDLLVFGAQEASAISTLTRQGVVNKVLAQALCPVLTLATRVSANTLEVPVNTHADSEPYMAGTF